mmetsp:Transcript_30452/g.43652  ORF Transcript_30452/g.43652 Transcript_30452/m.43652 type:complete len:1107 (-) Transcript_30452:656-3976(-)
MFEPSQEQDLQSFGVDKKFTQAPYLQRNISAPPITDHNTDNMLPFKFDNEDSILYPYGNNSSNPSRIATRISGKKNGSGGELDSKYAELLNDGGNSATSLTNSLLSLSINEQKPRTPMDLIQADFPSTPSSVYSNRIAATNANNAEGRFEPSDLKELDLKATSIPEDSTSITASPRPASNSNINGVGANGAGGSGDILASSAGISLLNATAAAHVPSTTSNGKDDVAVPEKPPKTFPHLYATKTDISSSVTSNNSGASLMGQNVATTTNLQPTGPALRTAPVAAGYFPTAATSSPMSMLSSISGPSGGENLLSLPLNSSISPAGGLQILSSSGVAATGGDKGSNLFRNIIPTNGGYLPSDHTHSHPNNTTNNTSNPSGMHGVASAGVAAAAHNGMQPYSSLLGNNPSSILNNGLNPLAPSVNNMTSPTAISLTGVMGNGSGLNQGMQQHQGQQHQPAYYVQQAVYLDQNGQHIFYRTAAPSGQYSSDYMYPTGPDGTPMVPLGSDQMQGTYIPYSAPMSSLSQNGYWPAIPDQSLQNGGGSMSMYMNPAGQQQGMNVSGMDNTRRMVYNPATGQYNSIVTSTPNQMNGPMSGQNGRMVSNSVYGMNGNMMPGMVQNANMGLPTLVPRNPLPMGMGGGMGMQGVENDMNNMFHMNPRGDDGGMGMNNNHGGMNNMNRNMRDDMMDYNRDGRGGRDNYRNDRSGDRNNRNNDRDSRNGRNNNNSNRDNNSNNGVNPVRDPLVEEFRSTYGKSRQWGLRDLLGHVVAFCQDQHGSRFIQQRLEVCSDVDKQLIFDEIMPSAQSLMTDVFGNYVLQKLFEYGTPDQCEALALLLKGQSVQLAMQMYGCRVVQKALEYVNTPRLIELVSEFENPPLLLRCVHDSNGNHVIQKCIEIVSKVAKDAATTDMSEFLSARIQFIITAFQGKVKELSSHPYGCRVVQRILEHCSISQKSVILEELRQCCTDLVQDCYGNYVIQFVMQHGWEADRAVLIREVQSNLLDFSQHKFASNVVEKCLQYANKKDRDEMIWTIINVTFDLKSPVDAKGHCVLESMVRDPYANYVVQKVIDVSDERQRAAIMRYVKENITQLRRYTYGKHIIVRLEKITNEKF